MNKREFLKTSGALLAGSVLAQAGGARTNWSGNYTYGTDDLEKPATIEELQALMKRGGKLRALGTRHSFNGIADSRVRQVSLEKFKDMTLDEKSHTVKVGAGVKYGELAPYLDARGFALHNLASLPHISVAGAIATGTHGSGVKNGNLSTAVCELALVDARGETMTLSREKDGERFHGAVVSLGGLGIATSVTLDVQPTYQVSQVVYENLPFRQLERHLDDIFASGYSVSLFTDWQNHQATQVWIKSRVGKDVAASAKPTFFGATLAKQKLHPLAGHSAENCTEQMGIAGPWYERLPHFRMNFTPSSGAELQTEYFVARTQAMKAILAVEEMRDHVTPHLFITELRTIAADKLWMSPAYQRDAVAIHFTWKPEWRAVKDVLPMIEEKLAPFDARPHWAKLFTMAPARLQSLYPKLPDFRSLLTEHDPHADLRNEFVNTNVFA